ncbi:MAG: hypothetical protein JXM70_12935 [Pirellulales bacterium]|nr:hypothetical protein [Pirellulales bacterium]
MRSVTAFMFLSAVFLTVFLAAPCPAERPANPILIKLPFAFPRGMENTPVIFKGRPVLVDNFREPKPLASEMYLFLQDLATGQDICRFGKTFSFVNGFVDGQVLNVFATENTDDDWTHDIYRFWTSDLKTWKKELVVARKPGEHLFNCSVCRDDRGYIMAYESNVLDEKTNKWNFRFARSKDLSKWRDVEGVQFGDRHEKSFCACPCIRYIAPYYYVIYGAERNLGPGKHYECRLPQTAYVSLLARSKDLTDWELSTTKYPMLDPIAGEGINNTDADLFEYEGNTYIYYATGDQATWGTIRIAMYPGPMKEMFESYFPEGVPMIRFDAAKRKYLYPAVKL